MGKNSKETLLKRNKRQREWKEKIDPESFQHIIERKCKACGEIKGCQQNSSFNQDGIPQYKARCVDCHRKWMNECRRRSKYKTLANTRKKRNNRNRKQYAIDKLGGKCEICGYKKCIAALTFHHKDSSEKDFTIGAILDYSLEKLDAELKKCMLLCFNCHMELHFMEDSDGMEKGNYSIGN